MLKLVCPACGAEVLFKTRTAVFGVCTYCQSMLVRHDINLEAMGKMASLPPDMSPLQVGTTGRYETVSFELVGRLKISWADGNWNEWYAMLADGREAWLAEAQGFYMMSFPEEDVSKVPKYSHVMVGKKLKVNDKYYDVDDIKKATCVGSEGELPMAAPKGRESTSVDLSAEGGAFACIDYSKEGTRFYRGRYLEFDDLHFSNLREIDGW